MTSIGHALVTAAVAAMVRGNVTAAGRLVLEHVLGDRRRSAPAVPLPETARVGIKAAHGGFRITALGFDFTVTDLRLLAGHRVDNDEIFYRRWERTVTRARVAHGTFGRQPPIGSAEAGDGLNVTGFQFNGPDQKGDQDEQR